MTKAQTHLAVLLARCDRTHANAVSIQHDHEPSGDWQYIIWLGPLTAHDRSNA